MFQELCIAEAELFTTLLNAATNKMHAITNTALIERK